MVYMTLRRVSSPEHFGVGSIRIGIRLEGSMVIRRSIVGALREEEKGRFNNMEEGRRGTQGGMWECQVWMLKTMLDLFY